MAGIGDVTGKSGGAVGTVTVAKLRKRCFDVVGGAGRYNDMVVACGKRVGSCEADAGGGGRYDGDRLTGMGGWGRHLDFEREEFWGRVDTSCVSLHRPSTDPFLLIVE